MSIDTSSKMPEIALAEKLPADLQKQRFFDKGDHIRVEPKYYLGKTLFAQIAQVVRDLGGEYVSAGRDSHFPFPV